MSIVQNDTSPIGLYMTKTADNLPATGKTVTVQVSKNGGAFAAGAGTVAELSGGWYNYTPTSGEVGTLGDFRLIASATGCWDTPVVDRVVQAGPTAADYTTARAAKLDNLDAPVSAVKAKTDNLPTDPADESLLEAAITAVGNAVAALNNLSAAGVRAAVGLAAANLDAQLDALPTAVENAAAVLAAAGTAPIAANLKKVNDVTVVGDGSTNPWGA